jgi:hypothetical protein
MVGQAGSEGLHGPRLEFVVRKLKGTVTRPYMIAPPTQKQREKDDTIGSDLGNEVEMRVEPAGYIVFLPTGQCYRIREDMLVTKNRDFSREPNMIGYEQCNDNKSAMGRYKMARSEATREKAYREMEDEVIFACTKGLKDFRAFVENYDPNGKMPEPEKVAA